MIEQRDLTTKTQALRRAFEMKLNVKSRNLSQALRRAGRRLPRRVRKQGAVLLRVEHLMKNPKLARQVNPLEVDKAVNSISTHLATIDAADRRKGRWLSLAAALATNVLLVAALFILWLWWQGYVGI